MSQHSKRFGLILIESHYMNKLIQGLIFAVLFLGTGKAEQNRISQCIQQEWILKILKKKV